jgi:Mannitol repressor
MQLAIERRFGQPWPLRLSVTPDSRRGRDADGDDVFHVWGGAPYVVVNDISGCGMAMKFAKHLRELPEQRRHTAVMADITSSTQTDRAVAIIGAAFVDLVLLEAITARLARRDAKLIKELFEDRGPLQPFGARIDLGYALGIYGKGVYQDLKTIKGIRNAFAHAAEDIDFSTADVSRQANALNLSNRAIQYEGRPPPTTPRARYVHVVEMVTDCLLGDIGRLARGLSGDPILQIPGR